MIDLPATGPWKRKEMIGDAVLLLGDCLEILPVLPKVDAVITDPPYGIGRTAGGPESRAREKGAYAGAFEDSQEYIATVCARAIRECIGLAKRVALTCGRTNLWHYPPAADVGCFYQPAASGVSFWGRPTWQPILFYGTAPHNGEQLRPLHYTLTESPEQNGHPCPKPLIAWTWLVGKASKHGETVLDPFMGSGTTGVACMNLGRKFIGIEIEERYFNIAVERITNAQRQVKLFDAPTKPGQAGMFA